MFVFFLTQIKTGAPCRSERLAKYNQILRLVSLFLNNKIHTRPPSFQKNMLFLATVTNYSCLDSYN